MTGFYCRVKFAMVNKFLHSFKLKTTLRLPTYIPSLHKTRVLQNNIFASQFDQAFKAYTCCYSFTCQSGVLFQSNSRELND